MEPTYQIIQCFEPKNLFLGVKIVNWTSVTVTQIQQHYHQQQTKSNVEITILRPNVAGLIWIKYGMFEGWLKGFS